MSFKNITSLKGKLQGCGTLELCKLYRLFWISDWKVGHNNYYFITSKKLHLFTRSRKDCKESVRVLEKGVEV